MPENEPAFDLDGLLSRGMVVVTGKGGVGKTTVAATLALLAKKSGRRVLLAQFESSVDGGRLLGHESVGTEMAEVEPGLWVVNMTPRSALREYGMKIFRLRSIYRAVMENRTVRHFLRAIPGLDEYSMLGKAWFHTTEIEDGRPRFDLVIIDAPATGQAIKVLKVPQSILNTVPESMLTRDARSIHGFLTNSMRCGAVIVTLAEELPVTEALELELALREQVGMEVVAMIVNGLYPVSPSGPLIEEIGAALAADAPRTSTHDPRLPVLLEEARLFSRRRAINDEYTAWLADHSAVSRKGLPMLFVGALDRAQIELLALAFSR